MKTPPQAEPGVQSIEEVTCQSECRERLIQMAGRSRQKERTGATVTLN